MRDEPLCSRVLARLWSAEVREVNPWFQTDYRIAWITVLFASRGLKHPHVSASMAVLGLHPSRVWDAIVARRKALLGREYEKFYDAEGRWKPEPLADPWSGTSPRKPVQSVRQLPLLFPPERDTAA